MKTYDMPFPIWNTIADHVDEICQGGSELYDQVEEYITEQYGLSEDEDGSLVYQIIDEKKFILFSLRFM